MIAGTLAEQSGAYARKRSREKRMESILRQIVNYQIA